MKLQNKLNADRLDIRISIEIRALILLVIISIIVFWNVVYIKVCDVMQERQKVYDLQQQLELEMSRHHREHERDIEALTHELKNAKRKSEQELQRKVYALDSRCSILFFWPTFINITNKLKSLLLHCLFMCFSLFLLPVMLKFL